MNDIIYTQKVELDLTDIIRKGVMELRKHYPFENIEIEVSENLSRTLFEEAKNYWNYFGYNIEETKSGVVGKFEGMKVSINKNLKYDEINYIVKL